jgi:hypothetical protein
LHTNENNTASVWKNNFIAMAKSLLPDKVRELIDSCKGLIADQLKPYIISAIGGAFA